MYMYGGPLKNIQHLYLYSGVTKLYKMHRKFGNHWMEYIDPIDLMYHSSNNKYIGIEKEPTTSIHMMVHLQQ